MKKNISQLFEEATAEELEPIVKQIKTPAAPAGVLARVKAKTGFAAKQSRRPILYAAAACAALVLCAAFALPLLKKFAVSEPHIPLNALVSPEKVSGISQKTIVVSSSLNGTQAELAPPTYRFDFYEGAFIVRAKVTENYPSLYYTLSEIPQAYRLIKLEILDVLRGENVPEKVLYLLPSDRFTDLSVYDSLILSMRQVGTADYYVLRNDTDSI